MQRIGLYAGSFDPITNGHIATAAKAALLFDTLIVAAAVNPAKTGRFAAEERLRLIRESLAHIPNIEIDSFTGDFTAKYALRKGAHCLVRGVRNNDDLQFEMTQDRYNTAIEPRVQTILILPPDEFSHVSSSMIMSLVGIAGWEHAIKPYVSPAVFAAIKAQHERNQ